MALWKRNKRYWTRFVVNGVKFRKPLRPPGQSRATTNWKEAVQLERDVIEQARNGALTPKAGPSRLFAACDAYIAAKRATASLDPTNQAAVVSRTQPSTSPMTAPVTAP